MDYVEDKEKILFCFVIELENSVSLHEVKNFSSLLKRNRNCNRLFYQKIVTALLTSIHIVISP